MDEIVNAVFSRVAVALERKLDFGKPFRYVVADNTEWEVIDYARRRKRREPEVYLKPEDFPDPAAPETPTLAEEARALCERIAGLGDRDREFLAERMFWASSRTRSPSATVCTAALWTRQHRARSRSCWLARGLMM